jgi:hypothetical protein
MDAGRVVIARIIAAPAAIEAHRVSVVEAALALAFPPAIANRMRARAGGSANFRTGGGRNVVIVVVVVMPVAAHARPVIGGIIIEIRAEVGA